MNYSLKSIILGVLITTPILAAPNSYREVVQKLKFNTTKELVDRKGLGLMDLIGGLTGLGKKFRSRLEATTSDPSDFKPAENKLLHSRGVCAEAKWKILESTQATGLFQQGTEVPAVVRFSGGLDNSVWEENKTRLFGIAVKLFPTQHKQQKVQTANIFLMSQNGLEGDTRRDFFSKADGEVVFSNVIPEPTGFALKLIGNLFKKFDPNAVERPLYAVAETYQNNQVVKNAKTPFQILVRAQEFGHRNKGGGDFRTEIMSYSPGQMKFDISVLMNKGDRESTQAGVLEIGQPFMSDTCDQELHFHHHKNR